jgi:hypothetical protein
MRHAVRDRRRRAFCRIVPKPFEVEGGTGVRTELQARGIYEPRVPIDRYGAIDDRRRREEKL